MTGMQTATVGVLLTDAQGPDWDQAWATITGIQLMGDDESRPVSLFSDIVSVNDEDNTLQLLVDTMERCVNASEANIFLISHEDGIVSERVELDDLMADQRADVFGREGVDGCFEATHILASHDSGMM